MLSQLLPELPLFESFGGTLDSLVLIRVVKTILLLVRVEVVLVEFVVLVKLLLRGTVLVLAFAIIDDFDLSLNSEYFGTL